MGLISTLKSILGVGGRADREGEPTVTVEHEPEASAERAVTEPEPVTSTDEAADAGAEADETETDDAGAETAAVEGSVDPVETITGIGPAYAGRLEDAGVETVDDLAAADAGALAAETDLSETRIRGWIEQARGE